MYHYDGRSDSMNRQMPLEDAREFLTEFSFPQSPELLMTLNSPAKAGIHGIPRLNLLLHGQVDFLNFDGKNIMKTPLHAPGIYYCAAGGYQWMALPEQERESVSFCYFGSYIRIVFVKRSGEKSCCHTNVPLSEGGFMLIHAIEKLYEEKAPAAILTALFRRLFELTVHAVNTASDAPNSRVNWRWMMINDYLREHRGEKFSREDVAEHFQLSPGTISRLVKENSGMEYCKLQMKYRLEFACELLRCSMLTSEEIADRCGFNYASYFHRSFKKAIGKTPAQWRKEAK